MMKCSAVMIFNKKILAKNVEWIRTNPNMCTNVHTHKYVIRKRCYKFIHHKCNMDGGFWWLLFYFFMFSCVLQISFMKNKVFCKKCTLILMSYSQVTSFDSLLPRKIMYKYLNLVVKTLQTRGPICLLNLFISAKRIRSRSFGCAVYLYTFLKTGFLFICLLSL